MKIIGRDVKFVCRRAHDGHVMIIGCFAEKDNLDRPLEQVKELSLRRVVFVHGIGTQSRPGNNSHSWRIEDKILASPF